MKQGILPSHKVTKIFYFNLSQNNQDQSLIWYHQLDYACIFTYPEGNHIQHLMTNPHHNLIISHVYSICASLANYVLFISVPIAQIPKVLKQGFQRQLYTAEGFNSCAARCGLGVCGLCQSQLTFISTLTCPYAGSVF